MAPWNCISTMKKVLEKKPLKTWQQLSLCVEINTSKSCAIEIEINVLHYLLIHLGAVSLEPFLLPCKNSTVVFSLIGMFAAVNTCYMFGVHVNTEDTHLCMKHHIIFVKPVCFRF